MLTAHDKYEIYLLLSEGKSVVELAEKYKLNLDQFSDLSKSIMPEWGPENTETTTPHWVKVSKGSLQGFQLERRVYTQMSKTSNTLYFIMTNGPGKNLQYFSEDSLVKTILEEVERQNAV